MQLFSEEWFAGFQSALAEVDPADQPAVRVGIGQVVTGDPQGEIRYTILIGGGETARIRRGDLSDADVTMIESFATAQAIASGEEVADLVRRGRIKVRGDTAALFHAQEAFAAIGAALVELADETES